MKKNNSYPIILVHGFSGYGQDEALNKLFPYFGMWNADVVDFANHLGLECYAPSVGPFSSLWDRVCELYAHIVGGTVDYGKVHSERCGHKRYGKTYKALVPDWGTLDSKGKIKKINYIGHSFGGPTARMFMELLINGSEEEKNGTPDNELSDLFTGGKGDWVHSVTTLAGANIGVTLPKALGKYARPASKALLIAASSLSRSPFSYLYDSGLDQFGITSQKGEAFNMKASIPQINSYLTNEDCILNDLDPQSVQNKMKDYKTNPNTYYFAYAGCRTKSNLKGNQVPKKEMFLPLKPLSKIYGKYSELGNEWKENDGLINSISAYAPQTEAHEDFISDEKCNPGIWYNMPIEEKDHMSYMGVGEKPDVYWNFFYDIFNRICNIKSKN